MAVIFDEDKIEEYQLGRPNDSGIHRHVLRGSTDANIFGQLLVNGEIIKDRVFESYHTIEIGEDWNLDNLSATLLIWKKVGISYGLVNASQEKF